MKKTIQLKESDITRMVMEAVNELDWKTYANAAKKDRNKVLITTQYLTCKGQLTWI